jgi:hypothetical protein
VRDPTGRPGFRTRQITLVTTLLDAGFSRVADLAAPYCQRWLVETALAHLKTTMQVEPRVKTRRPKSLPLMIKPREELVSSCYS